VTALGDNARKFAQIAVDRREQHVSEHGRDDREIERVILKGKSELLRFELTLWVVDLVVDIGMVEPNIAVTRRKVVGAPPNANTHDLKAIV